ncbi:ribonuclease H-like domain-containing protein [Tanacetum coccineum]|uniref:Ribonuclease H-like domain-containing protein n=1 Tax=Tanacetum coccineum TaxID=301880 RepID=A0ABQ5HVY7_9ASTR
MSNTNTNLQTQTSNALHNAIMEACGKDCPPMLAPGNYNPSYKFKWTEKIVPVAEGSSETTTEGYMENYKNVSQDIRDQLNAEAEAVQIILTGIDNDIYSTVDACPNACEMWKAIERLKQACQKQCDVTNHQVNVQFLLQLQPEWKMFVTLVKHSQELKSVSYHKLYDILKQHQNKVNEIRAERLARTANPLALVAKKQSVYHPQTHPTHYTHNSLTKSQQAATKNRGKAIVNSSTPTYDQEPTMIAEDDEITSSNTSRANQDNTSRINKDTGYDNQRVVNVAGARENVADWRDDIDDEPDDQELKAHYMYMAQIQEVTSDAADNSGPIFNAEPLQKVQNNDDNYNVFAIVNEHPEQPESVNDTYLEEQGTLTSPMDSLASVIMENRRTRMDMILAKETKFQGDMIDNAYHDVNYASKVAIDCAKAKGDLMSYKMESEKSFNEYTRKINDLNQTISEMKKELFAHQETISIMSQEKEAQINFYKTREYKEIDKVIALENKVRVLDNIVYKTGQSVQTINMLNRNCKMSFAKPEFLKKAQRANPCLYDIGYNDNLALMLAHESDKMIRLAKESRSKLSDLIRPFDYDQLNNLYDLFVPQREKSPEQQYFSKESKMSHTSTKNENSKESFNKHTTLLEKRMDESIPWDQKINADLEKFHLCLKEEMVADLRYFNSLEHEVDSLNSQLDTQKTQFLNEIDRLSREYYYADHMNAILGVYTEMDKVTNLQCDYLEALVKCERLEKELSKNRTMSKSFKALQKYAINLELALQQCKEQIKNDKSFKENQSNVFMKEREQYFKIQDLKSQLQDKGIVISLLKKLIEKMKEKSMETKFKKSSVIRQPNAFKSQRQSILGVIPTTSVSRPHLKSNPLEDRVMPNNSQGKKQEVEDHRRNFKFLNNKTSITACNDSLNAKTSNVNFVCVTCGKCVVNDNHDIYVLHYINGVNSRTKMPMAVPISTREHKRTVNQSVVTPLMRIVALESTSQKPRHITRKLYEHVSKTCSWWYPKFTPFGYKWKPKSPIGNVNTNVIMPLGNASRTANILEPMTPRCFTVSNTPLSSNSFAARRDNPIHRRLWGTVKLGNDQIAPILGYGDLVQEKITIKKVYYVEGLNHNLFSVGQLCDADLEVAFRKSTCYIRDLKGNDLLTGSCGTYLYSITLQDTSTPNLICLMAKVTSSQVWLWHRRLSHLNFDTINFLSKNDIVIGLPKLKFFKDRLCSSCELGKSKRKSFHTKTTPSSKRRLQLLRMDLCGPIRIESINGKKYVFVIVDDYSRYTWTHFLRSKDETPEVLIDFLRLVQRGLHAQVRIVRTDKGT